MLIGLVFGLGNTPFAVAQSLATFPAKPVRFIVPLTQGGSNDIIARTIAERLSGMWPHPVLVENRPGAGSNIGTELVAKSAPDGHTWLLAPNNVFVVNPHLGKTGFDPFKDFTPVMQLAQIAFLLTVNAQVPANNVPELIALAKAKPNSLAYGSAGNGAPHHLGAAMFNSMTGIEMLHVPFKGAIPGVTELLAGRIQVWIGASNTILPHIQAGKLRALGSAGSKRFPVLPDLPTIAEAGVPGYAMDIWLGLALPANAPPEVVNKIHADVSKALGSAELREKFSAQGIDISLSTPSELTRTIRDDYERWGKVIKTAGIKGD